VTGLIHLRLSTIGVVGAGGGLPPVNTVLPVVTGALNTGATDTATTGTWTGTAPITYAYQWCYALLDGAGAVLTDGNGRPLGVAIAGKTSSTYVIEVAYVGGFIFCIITATNADGSSSADSDARGPVT
jgi:hypothetical protein